MRDSAKVSRKAKVDELDMMVRIQKNISRLQVPVQNALALKVLQRLLQLQKVLDEDRGGEPFPLCPACVQHCFQTVFAIFHDKVHAILVKTMAPVVHEVGMTQARQHRGFSVGSLLMMAAEGPVTAGGGQDDLLQRTAATVERAEVHDPRGSSTNDPLLLHVPEINDRSSSSSFRNDRSSSSSFPCRLSVPTGATVRFLSKQQGGEQRSKGRQN